MKNYIKLRLPAISENESYARSAVSALALPLSPTVEELNDIKTSVSEAVTNCVVHAYPGRGELTSREILIEAELSENEISITVTDFGVGINDVEKAMEPFFTTRPADERSGMGFTIMKSFMDIVEVKSKKDEGTTIKMIKHIGARNA